MPRGGEDAATAIFSWHSAACYRRRPLLAMNSAASPPSHQRTPALPYGAAVVNSPSASSVWPGKVSRKQPLFDAYEARCPYACQMSERRDVADSAG